MNNNDETLADILAEMREYDNEPPPKRAWLDLADRIEAAWKRDKSNAIKTAMMCKCEICKEQGNAAAMREALEAARAALSSYADGGDEDNAETNAVLAEIDAALAAPARNIDRFATEGEAWKFYLDHVPDNGNLATGYAEWLFATELIYGDAAAEGGAE